MHKMRLLINSVKGLVGTTLVRPYGKQTGYSLFHNGQSELRSLLRDMFFRSLVLNNPAK